MLTFLTHMSQPEFNESDPSGLGIYGPNDLVLLDHSPLLRTFLFAISEQYKDSPYKWREDLEKNLLPLRERLDDKLGRDTLLLSRIGLLAMWRAQEFFHPSFESEDHSRIIELLTLIGYENDVYVLKKFVEGITVVLELANTFNPQLEQRDGLKEGIIYRGIAGVLTYGVNLRMINEAANPSSSIETYIASDEINLN